MLPFQQTSNKNRDVKSSVGSLFEFPLSSNTWISKTEEKGKESKTWNLKPGFPTVAFTQCLKIIIKTVRCTESFICFWQKRSLQPADMFNIGTCLDFFRCKHHEQIIRWPYASKRLHEHKPSAKSGKERKRKNLLISFTYQKMTNVRWSEQFQGLKHFKF